jgi:hypothetical protein
MYVVVVYSIVVIHDRVMRNIPLLKKNLVASILLALIILGYCSSKKELKNWLSKQKPSFWNVVVIKVRWANKHMDK